MTTSLTTGLSEPLGDDVIPVGTLAYFRSRFKRRLYDRMVEAFESSGLTQTSLAKRLGLGTDRICRVLGGPGNLTLDTVSDIMFAAGGAEFDLSISYPLKRHSMAAALGAKQAQDQQPENPPNLWTFVLPNETINLVGIDLPKQMPAALTGSDASSWLYQLPHHSKFTDIHARFTDIDVEEKLKSAAA
jgi:hypothetical protein